MVPGLLLAASLVIAPAQAAKIDDAVHQVMESEHISGLSLGIGRAGTIALERSYGDARPQTVYPIGSLTKQFTAALVLQETDRGTIGLSMRNDGVSVAELLAQTSGLSDDQATPLFDPGDGWHYSNLNYVRLGTILRTATGEPFGQLLDERIVRPLQLRSTSVDDSPEAAAVGMKSDVHDLLTWLDALRSGRVLPAAQFAAMTTSQTLSTGERTHYGYGWYVRNWYGWPCVEHPGYVPGYSADDALVLEDGLEIVVLAKANDAFLLPITKTIVSLLEQPRDQSLVADFAHPAENENPSVTRDIGMLVRQLQTGTLDRTRLSAALNARLNAQWLAEQRRLLAPLGDATLIEFIGRTSNDRTVLEKYRVSFGYKQFWMTIAYDAGNKIDTLMLEPDKE